MAAEERKSFYNEYEAVNEDGARLIDETCAALQPVIRMHLDMGYSLREIEHIMMLAIHGDVSTMILIRASAKKREQRQQEKK